MRIDFPGDAQKSALRRLWKQAFGDDDAFLDRFFETAYSPDRCRCVLEDGGVSAALYWLDMHCRDRRIAYFYAVATDEACRSRGLCRRLMADAHDILQSRGYAGSILVPESGGLGAMYEKMGYRFCSSIRRFDSTPGPGSIPCRQIGREEYLRLRERLLPEGGVQLGEEALALLDSLAAFYAGEDFLLTAVRNDGTLVCPELLGDTAAAPGILKALGASRGSFRTAGPGEPFAMYRPIDPQAPAPAYFGLAFD